MRFRLLLACLRRGRAFSCAGTTSELATVPCVQLCEHNERVGDREGGSQQDAHQAGVSTKKVTPDTR